MRSGRRRRILEAAATALVPPARGLSPAEWEAFHGLIERTLAEQPLVLRGQIALFLFFLRWSPLLRYGKTLELLAPAARGRFLSWVEAHPVRLLRTGFWGIKTLVYMGYYGRPEVWPALRYDPSFEGNKALR